MARSETGAPGSNTSHRNQSGKKMKNEKGHPLPKDEIRQRNGHGDNIAHDR